jgi:hypothetical protein
MNGLGCNLKIEPRIIESLKPWVRRPFYRETVNVFVPPMNLRATFFELSFPKRTIASNIFPDFMSKDRGKFIHSLRIKNEPTTNLHQNIDLEDQS